MDVTNIAERGEEQATGMRAFIINGASDESGLTAGATSPIGGQALEKAGWMTKHLRAGLDIASQALAQGQPMPDAAVRSAAKCFVPPLFFRWVANRMMRSKAGRTGMDINARPYARTKSNA
jgi:hypothetical protein